MLYIYDFAGHMRAYVRRFLFVFYRNFAVITSITSKLAILVLPRILVRDRLHDVPVLSDLAVLYSPQIIERSRHSAESSFGNRKNIIALCQHLMHGGIDHLDACFGKRCQSCAETGEPISNAGIVLDIRNVVLEKIVSEAISDLCTFVRCHESEFVELMEQRQNGIKNASLQKMKKTVESTEKRISEIDRMMIRIYEDNVNSKISDDRFYAMRDQYEAEQRKLKTTVQTDREELLKAESTRNDFRLLLKTVRDRTDNETLTSELVNSLIERIEVHNPVKIDGHKRVQVDIYFTGVGRFKVPNEAELVELFAMTDNGDQRSA